MFIISFNWDLCHHWKCNSIVSLAKCSYLLIRARLLRAKVVGWKTDYSKAFIFVLIIQCFEPFILPGKTAFRRNVYYTG